VADLQHPAALTGMLEPADGVATVQGMPLVVPDAERSSVSRRLMATGVTEPRFTDVAGRLVGKGAHVLDVGANIGYFTCIMARNAGRGGRVVAFEPVERPRAYLAHNVRANGFDTVTVDAHALADWTGEGQVTLPKYRLEPRVPEAASAAFETPVARLDDLAGELGLDRVDVIKMDIEGSEARALEGMRGILERRRPTLAIEVHPSFLSHYGDSVAGLRALFGELGYGMVAIEPADGPETNYHVVAGPTERLQRAKLLPRSKRDVRFSLAGDRGWSRGDRSVVSLRAEGDTLELAYALGEGEKEYIVTAEHTTGTPPADRRSHPLDGDRYTELRWEAEFEGTARCALWLFEYDRRRLVAQTSLPLVRGAQMVPHVSAPSARSYRLGLRVSGAGTIRLERLDLLQA
jgi:FkbM family methyltransferase